MPEELRDGVRYEHNTPPLALYIAGEDMPAKSAVCQSRQSKNILLLADANDPNRMPCIGALQHSAKAYEEALIVPAGMVVGLQKTGDFLPGGYIYVSTTPGYFSKDAPETGTSQVVGIARNSNSGLLFAIPPSVAPGIGHKLVGNHTIVPGDGTNEVKFAYEGAPDEFAVWHHGYLWCELDLSNIGSGVTVTGRLYHKIDGVNLKQICRKHAKKGTDEDHLTLGGAVTAGKTIQVSLQLSSAVPSGQEWVVRHAFIQDT